MPFRLSLCLGQCATNRGTKGEKVLLKNEPLSFPAESTEAEGQTSGDSTWDSITAQPPSVQVRTRSGETLVNLTMDYVVPFPPPTKNGGVWERKSRPWWEHASLPARSPSATRSSGPELFSIGVRTDTLKHLLVAKTGVEMQKVRTLLQVAITHNFFSLLFPQKSCVTQLFLLKCSCTRLSPTRKLLLKCQPTWLWLDQLHACLGFKNLWLLLLWLF